MYLSGALAATILVNSCYSFVIVRGYSACYKVEFDEVDAVRVGGCGWFCKKVRDNVARAAALGKDKVP